MLSDVCPCKSSQPCCLRVSPCMSNQPCCLSVCPSWSRQPWLLFVFPRSHCVCLCVFADPDSHQPDCMFLLQACKTLDDLDLLGLARAVSCVARLLGNLTPTLPKVSLKLPLTSCTPACAASCQTSMHRLCLLTDPDCVLCNQGLLCKQEPLCKQGLSCKQGLLCE